MFLIWPLDRGESWLMSLLLRPNPQHTQGCAQTLGVHFFTWHLDILSVWLWRGWEMCIFMGHSFCCSGSPLLVSCSLCVGDEHSWSTRGYQKGSGTVRPDSGSGLRVLGSQHCSVGWELHAYCYCGKPGKPAPKITASYLLWQKSSLLHQSEE